MKRRATRFVVAAVWGTAVLTGAAAVRVPAGATAPPDQQPASFRASVDLIAVDVQVVNNEGVPIGELGAEDFEVLISGKRRRVVSANYVRSTNVDGTAFSQADVEPVATNIWPGATDRPIGRIYILAFDVGSLTVSDSRAVVGSALTFIDRLLPTDMVGLYTFPIGQRIEPTTDHAAVRAKVSAVVGSPQGFNSHFNLSASEIIDINAESARLATLSMGRGNTPAGRGGGSGAQNVALFGDESDTIRAVQLRECGLTEVRCVDEIQSEAQALAFYLEGRATEGLNGLRALIDVLTEYPGRKTVVMFSSGIPASDRPGGRPDLGDLPKTLGQDAAATNTAIYTLHVDTREFQAMSAETRRAAGTPSTRSRDHAVAGRALEEFSGASGGALMRVLTGSGEYALDRVLRETSSHYLLGVEPENSDRDGRLRELRVRVNHDGATVRSRMWVVVPKRGAAE
jgi:VWFA-related protein